MELMTPVFLCAFVALLPQALGKTTKNISPVSGLVNNKFKYEKQLYDTNSLTKFDVSTNTNKVSDLQSVFMNPICKECHNCMEQSIKAHKVHSRMNIETKANDVPNEIDNLEDTTHRNKRNLEDDPDIKNDNQAAKKSKAKKSKNNKSVSVTKYSNEGKLYALKVRETKTPILDQLNQTKPSVFKCQVYKVTDYFPCNSPDADLLLREIRKINKTSTDGKRNKENNLPIKNKETGKLIVPQFKKRYVVEESQVQENFMPSIEELY